MAFNSIDRLLRGQAPAQSLRDVRFRLGVLIIAGSTYGAVMGAFGGLRARQALYSATKVPLFLLATFALSLPSFFVVNTLVGLRNDFSRALAAIAGCQATLTLILVSLAPFTALWYLSDPQYPDAILFNALMFAVASFSAQIVLRRSYRPLIARNSRHRPMLGTWLCIYIFVGIQMAWVLRPFIGEPALPTRFLRPDAFSNAYISVAHIIADRFR